MTGRTDGSPTRAASAGTPPAGEPVTVAVLGTGIMGAPMARNLALAGHRVRAWNRTPEKAAALAGDGVQVMAGADDACRGADVCIVMLSDGPTCDRVLFGDAVRDMGAAHALPRGAVLVVMSSIPVEAARTQAQRAAALGLRYVDAPVSGGEGGAKAATLAIMAGADPDTFATVEPVLRAMGRPTRVGGPGAGSLAKLCNQMIVAVTIGAVAEAMLLARAGGADPEGVRTALMGGFADSRILDVHGARMLRGDWVPGGPSKYQLKDVRTAVAFARSLGLRLPAAELLEGLYADLCDNGGADLDHSALIREIARRNGMPDLAEPEA